MRQTLLFAVVVLIFKPYWTGTWLGLARTNPGILDERPRLKYEIASPWNVSRRVKLVCRARLIVEVWWLGVEVEKRHLIFEVELILRMSPFYLKLSISFIRGDSVLQVVLRKLRLANVLLINHSRASRLREWLCTKRMPNISCLFRCEAAGPYDPQWNSLCVWRGRRANSCQSYPWRNFSKFDID